MDYGVVFGSILILAVLGSVWLVVRDVRLLHRQGRSLADKPGDAAGVSAAAMVWQSQSGMR